MPHPSFAKCVYSYAADSVKVGWTGYKFTAKAAAKGQFKKIKVIAKNDAGSAEELLKSTRLEIDPTSSDTGDKARDMNLKDHFFSLLVGPTITATLKSISKDKATVSLVANGVQKDVEFKVKESKGHYEGEADIDVMNFSMKKAFEELGKTCQELHKGADGVVKTWTEVHLNVSADVTSNCDKK